MYQLSYPGWKYVLPSMLTDTPWKDSLGEGAGDTSEDAFKLAWELGLVLMKSILTTFVYVVMAGQQ